MDYGGDYTGDTIRKDHTLDYMVNYTIDYAWDYIIDYTVNYTVDYMVNCMVDYSENYIVDYIGDYTVMSPASIDDLSAKNADFAKATAMSKAKAERKDGED
ncbi:hypothetical protein MMC31_007145 [Peltigera leucophlebia]|nr:hypothetical protein [Peltigera leucophlebia]